MSKTYRQLLLEVTGAPTSHEAGIAEKREAIRRLRVAAEATANEEKIERARRSADAQELNLSFASMFTRG